MKLVLRIITIVCYFVPFTFFLSTCNNGLKLGLYYSQEEANKNILLEKESTKVVIDSNLGDHQILADTTKIETLTKNIIKPSVNIPSDTLQKSSDYGDKILRKIVMPTSTSLSGIGSIFFFKSITGQITIAISLLISFILFVAFNFLKSQRARPYLILADMFCMTIFIIDSIISNVTLLWGCWTLLILLMFQLILELGKKTKTHY